MSVQNLWPLAFLLLIPVIILLYILKQRAVDRDFSSNLLWKEIYRNLEATTPFDKLKRNILMYLQILLLILLILALMSPFLKNGGKASENLVLVMDTSGSMLYEHEDDGTRLDYAVNQACALVDSANESAVVTIISCDSEASIVYQGTDKITAKLRLNSLTAQEEAGTLDLAAALVNSIISDMDNVRVVCYTDTVFSYDNLISSNEDAALSLVNAYSEGENCAVDYISYALDGNGVTVLCKVTNYGTQDVKQDLSLYSDGQIVDLQSITLMAGTSSTFYFEDCEIASDGSVVIRAELSASDALDADNVQKAVVTESNEKKVLLLSAGNVFLEKALGLDENVTVYKSESLAVLNQTADLYDLYVFDGIAPSEDEEGWLLNIPDNAAIMLLNQSSDLADFGGISLKSTAENVVLSFYETDVTNYLSDYSFGMTEAYTYTLPAWGIPLISTADGDSVGYYGTNGSHMVAVLGFDIHNSDLALQSEFPIFMSQLTSALLESSTEVAEVSNFPTAEESSVTAAEEGIVADGGDLVRSGGRSLRNIILLLVIVLLVVEWVIYIRQVHTSKKRQFLVVRICVLACVVLAMAGLSITVTQQKAQTIFLVDVSDSMSGNLSEMENYIQQAISDMPEKNSSAIVLFGKDTAVEEFMTDTKTFSKFTTTPVTTATDIQNAVETACSMFDEGVTKRLVLITDGSENEGNMSLAASTVTAGEVELNVITMEDSISDGNEVYVENLSVPSVIRVGDKYNITVTVVSNVETNARLSLYAGRSLKGQQEIHLTIGTNQFVFEDAAEEETIAQYKAVIEADDDTISVNNTYVTYAEIEATARVLLIEGTTGNSEEFQKLLDAANIVYDCLDPSAVPSTVAGLLSYKAVITLDVYYDDLKSGFAEALDTYVKDYAGGYICIGGNNSYALGNYRDTVLEDVLPVTVDPQGEEEIPKIAMAMVIDHSGSMSATANENSTVTALMLAKQAAIAGAAELRETDEVGVLAFDDSFDWVLPMQLADDQNAIESAISSIIVEGGTDIHNALVEAYNQISKSDASIKHIILLTDGEDGYMEYESLFEEINDAGITLSTVAVGADSATSALQWMAESCGGRYYYTDISTSIPRIFAQEVYLSTNTYLLNGEFYPSVTSSNEILSGLYEDGLPAFLGYIATSAKNTADVLLTSENGDPLLAVWQYGLGKTVAWTSDGTNEWTANYAQWDNYPQLWANIINYVISDNSLGEDEIEITASGSQAAITYQIDDYDASTSVTAVITDEDGKQQEITLDAISPGVYEADMDLDTIGIYSINLRKYEDGELAASYNTAYANQYSKEYQFTESTGALASFIEQCGGSSITMEDTIWKDVTTKVKSRTSLTMLFLVLSVILWMIDIALRRLSIDLAAAARRAGHIAAHGFKLATAPVAALPGKLRKNRAKKVKGTSPDAAGKKSKAKAEGQEATVEGQRGKNKSDASNERLDMDQLLKKKKERE